MHPSTLEVLSELGPLDEFLKRPHQELRQISGVVGGARFKIADLSHLPVKCKFVAIMPQWDFLDFLASHARRYPNFHLLMQAEATELLHQNGVVTGVKAQTSNGPIAITPIWS